MSVNKVILVGNLGKDPEVRTVTESSKVARFTLATNERYKDKAGVQQSKTEWHNIEAWSPLAEICERFLKKGSQVYIEGKIQSREYVDPKDNINRRITEIRVKELTLLGSPQGQNAGSGATENTAPSNYNEPASKIETSIPAIEDDLPF